MIKTLSDAVKRGYYVVGAHRRGCEAILRDDTAEMTVTICGNGSKQYKFRCVSCRRDLTGSIPHRLLDVGTINSAIMYHDGTEVPPCERCGVEGQSEWHHWSPRNIFPDSDEWPGAYLCRTCHARWHAVMDNYSRYAKRPEDAP